MLLSELQRYVRRHGLAQSGQEVSYDERLGFGEQQPQMSTAVLLEPPLQAHSLEAIDPLDSQFTYFLDGIQRSWLLYEVNYVPVYYGYTAAVIRQRCDRLMHTWLYRTHEAIYLPLAHISPLELANLQNQGFPLVDTMPQKELHPLGLRDSAREAIANRRQQLETELAEQWIKARLSGWLVMDGAINPIHPRIIGVIKSHHTQYFPFPEQAVVLGLRAGQRSSMFQPAHRTGVCSWYVRLRDNSTIDPYFGLIRIEASPQTPQQANSISQWLMAERRPLALPDSRWDRMIYPIRDCEQYLRSHEPRLVIL
jgi:hypothetical protein